MMQLLRVRVWYRRGHVLVAVAGEVDIASARQLRECLALAMERGLPVITDLDRVTFIDAAGLGTLAGAARRAAAQGIRMRLVCSRPQTRKLLRLTGLDGQLGLCPTRAEAVAALSPVRTGPGTSPGQVPARGALAQLA